jgi:hypothetical protein
MIPLQRIRTTDAIHPNFKGAKRIANNLNLLTLKKEGKLESGINKVLDSSIWGNAKDQLLLESKNKCAYCETPTAVVAYGDVEHFRPKSTYWWLTYSLENYLPSCTICNQKYKKDKFATKNKAVAGPLIKKTTSVASLNKMAPFINTDPLNDIEGMTIKDFTKIMKKENALLINPYFDDPSTFLAYKPILENNEVLIIATKTKYQPIIKACEDFFGINRKELMDLRFQHYCTYMTYKHFLTIPNLGKNYIKMLHNRIEELLANGSRYAGMIRFLETQPLQTLPWDFNLLIDLN